MGYAKWRLGMGDKYQIDVARYRVGLLLQAHAQDIDGPIALGCEVPVEGWDDIVEFCSQKGEITATHYQVKRQNTDFKAGDLQKTFAELFKSAAAILKEDAPYDGFVVRAKHRRFVFVLPTGDISVGAKLGIDQLVALLPKCSTASAAQALVSNDGGLINDGKEGGDQQRRWLLHIKASAGTPEMCERILQQMSVEIWPSAFVEEQAAALVAMSFDLPDCADLLIDNVLRRNPPEGLIDAEKLLAELVAAKPKPALLRVKLARSGDVYFVQPFTRLDKVASVAKRVVHRVWREHDSVDLQVGYAPPNATKTLRLACVRLLLHAARSPVHVKNRDAWLDRCRSEVAWAVGLTSGKGALEGAHFKEKEPSASLPPKVEWAPEVLGHALQIAMDAYIWKRVCAETKLALELADGVSFDEVMKSMRELVGFFDAVLRGWWVAEEAASGIARAGPSVAHGVAQIVAGMAVLQHLGFSVAAADTPGTIAKLGDLPVRALAIEQVGGIADKLPRAEELSWYARELIAFPGVVLLIGGSEGLYDMASGQPLDEPVASAGILTSTASAFLIDAGLLVASVRRGDQFAKSLVQTWCDRRAEHHRSALDAALQQWGESDAA